MGVEETDAEAAGPAPWLGGIELAGRQARLGGPATPPGSIVKFPAGMGYKERMRPFFLVVPLLLVACVPSSEPEVEPPPPPKTDIDLASDCLHQLAECTDWEPVSQAPLPPRTCETCDKYEFECQERRDRCIDENHEDTNTSLKSSCQLKAEICIRLVEATGADKEVHHHSSK
jgi:hypothetical protein